MCGIFAISKKNNFELSTEIKNSILCDLKHRGPDAFGVNENERSLLIHTRLKIIDLSDNANQPMFSGDQRFAIIFNGECYNFQSLRNELTVLGVKFRTNSDTEVILEAFILWGESFIQKIAGMFSIVIYDFSENTMFVWRDRLGIKPLYCGKFKNGIYVSSEIKPLLNFHDAQLNEGALWSYFNLRFTAGHETLFSGIQEVNPGEFIKIKDGVITSQYNYWDLRNIQQATSQVDMMSLLNTIINEHNVSDAPVACLLSGGIDSSVIAAISGKNGYKLDSYTFSTNLKDDETEKAKIIADYLGLKNNQVSHSEDDFSLYKSVINKMEDPIGDSIILPTYLLAKHIAKTSKVVLSGEGADEIFSSYIHHQILNMENKIFQFIPHQLLKPLSVLIRHTPLAFLEMMFPYPANLGLSGRDKLANHLASFNDDLSQYFSLVGLFTDGQSEKIFREKLIPPKAMKDYWTSMEKFSFADKLKRFDLFYWGRNYTLHRLDRLTMASSLEARVPYFDHRFVEFVLMNFQKIHFLDPKKDFRNNLPAKILPKDVIRRKKQAFYLPVEKVFSNKTLTVAKEMILDNSDKRGIFNKSELERLLFGKNELLDSKQFQCLLNFELWNQNFID